MDNEDLKELNAIFSEMGGVEKVEEHLTNFENLPDGDYSAEIAEVTTETSKNTGRPMIKIALAVEGGKKESMFLMLAGKDLKATQTAIARTVTQLKKLGIEGSDITDFVNGASGLVGKRVNYKVETNNGYVNRSLTLA